jgi:acetoacetyl-CoA synthetase
MTTPDPVVAPEAAPAPEPIWTPDPAATARSQIGHFAAFVTERHGVHLDGYLDMWAWSVDHTEQFWASIWEFFAITSSTPYEAVLELPVMPGARWFSGARLNYAQHALRFAATDEPAILAVTEDGSITTTSWDELRSEVGAFAGWLRAVGVGKGDRVVGYLPNGRHAVVAFLATASLGAVWSACGQDYGAAGAAARFAQLEPVVLVAADGYQWAGHVHDRRDAVRELREALPTVRATVAVDHLGLARDADDPTISWAVATAVPSDLHFEQVAFGDPLWVLFSSGTTGPPKGIVHGHGGVVLDHHKMLGLHFDLRGGDSFFWYTNTNWMMWNVVVSGLLVGATVVLYDGNPTYPGPLRLFELAARHGARVLGVSPGYLLACEKAGVEPGRDLDLSRLEVLASTGSPLPAVSYDWVRDHVSRDVQLDSTSGGTDIVTAFAGSAPTTPVWAGEVSAPMLGVALDAWDPDGRSVIDQVGELVVTKPMPSMPLYFWNDPDGSRYHDAYFSTYPGVWRHGDWITRTNRGSVIISGRSDSTLNRQGVRLGSADIYQVVEKLPEISEALVIGAELADGGYWMPLFVVLEPGKHLDDDLKARIVAAIRREASPRHVPDQITAVPAIPHTRTGKKLEVPVKRLLQGTPLDQVANSSAVDDPTVLAYFSRFVHES